MKYIKSIYDFLNESHSKEFESNISEIAKDIVKPFGESAAGVFFYGSCLHTGKVIENVLDFYIIVDDYTAAFKKPWLRIAGKLCPPNVFYHEIKIDDQLMRSKYAVISQSDFVKRCGLGPLNCSIWARFCQPAVLIFTRDDVVKQALMAAVATAAESAVCSVLPLYSYVPSSMELWSEIFRRTYGAELRSEREQKALEIYIMDQDRYDTFTSLVFKNFGIDSQKTIYKQPPRLPILKAQFHWWLRRLNGKVVSLIRLIKASITFEGGIDYLAWKIKRHSGVELEVKPWMRRYPLIAGLVFFWRMKRRNAFR